MTVSVRCFGHRGTRQMNVVLPKQYSADSVQQLAQPYEWAQYLALADAGAAQATTPTAVGDQTTILRVEVQDGKSIRYEVNPPNRAGGPVVAGNTSPILSGHDQFEFGQGWSFSCIDASALP